MASPFAIILGAGPGVGAATARRLAAAGYDLGLLARDPARLEAMAMDLEAGGARVARAAVDLGDHDALATTLRRMADATGRVDVLLHNASVGRAVRARDLDGAGLLADLAVGTASAAVAVSALLPVLLAQRTGTVLATGGGTADRPFAGAASLGPQKAALRALVQVLAADLRDEGIHVATVTVRGLIEDGTPFAAGVIADLYADLIEETAGDPAGWRTVVDLTAEGPVTVH